MTVAEARATRVSLFGQLGRFVVVGVGAAVVDFGTYQLFLHVGVWVHLAKALSFILGTTTAYLLNRRWTFNAQGGSGQAVGFAVLYSVTFFVNIGVNALALHALSGMRWQVPMAWVVAQAMAAMINFILLRTVVFRK